MPTEPIQTAAKERVDKFTSDASDCVRALALATIAVAWLFLSGTAEDKGATVILKRVEGQHLLAWALGFAIASLVFDALQYAGGALAAQRADSKWAQLLRPDEANRRTDGKNRRAWSWAAKVGFVEGILESGGRLTAAERNDRAVAVTTCKKLIDDYRQAVTAAAGGTPMPAPYPAVKDYLAQPIAPSAAVTWTRFWFWAKLAVAAAGGVCLGWFCLDLVL